MEIKNCPFCGGEVTVVTPEDEYQRLNRSSRNSYAIQCQGCELLFGWDIDYGGTFASEEDAIEQWNTRHE